MSFETEFQCMLKLIYRRHTSNYHYYQTNMADTDKLNDVTNREIQYRYWQNITI